MNRPHAHVFENTIQKSKEWLKEVGAELHLPTEQDAYSALRAVLHALRDRLPIQEAVELGAQLPMLIRGFYYEGWNPVDKPLKIRKIDQFYELVERELRDDLNAVHVTEGVLRVLEKRITQGEMSDVRDSMPEEILTLWPKEIRSGA